VRGPEDRSLTGDQMIIPVRCFSCGKVIGSDYRKFAFQVNKIREQEREPKPEEIQKILDDLNIKRYCCRRMIISHVDLIDEILPFS
jgi:DNA-directed RNA polymerase subunit N